MKLYFIVEIIQLANMRSGSPSDIQLCNQCIFVHVPFCDTHTYVIPSKHTPIWCSRSERNAIKQKKWRIWFNSNILFAFAGHSMRIMYTEPTDRRRSIKNSIYFSMVDEQTNMKKKKLLSQTFVLLNIN